LGRVGAFAIVAEERGFLKLSRALKLITQRRFFFGGSLLFSGRVIHRDGDSLILEPQRSSRTAFLLRTGLISLFGNRAVGSRHLVRAWLASRDPLTASANATSLRRPGAQ
jgi:hypothetical protein